MLKDGHHVVHLSHAVGRAHAILHVRVVDQQAQLLDKLLRRDTTLIPMQNVIPQDLCLRDAEEVVHRLKQNWRLIGVEREHSRGVHSPPQHQPLARRHVVRAQRIEAVVASRRYIDRINHKELDG